MNILVISFPLSCSLLLHKTWWEGSFGDPILAHGDLKKFKLFHSLWPAGGSQVTSARWRPNQLLNLVRQQDTCFVMSKFRRLFLQLSSARFGSLRSLSRGSFYSERKKKKGRGDKFNSEHHHLKNKAKPQEESSLFASKLIFQKEHVHISDIDHFIWLSPCDIVWRARATSSVSWEHGVVRLKN